MTKTSRIVLSRTPSRTPWLIAALALPMFASNVAFADEVCGTTTCQKGFVCQSYEMGKCTGGTRIDVGGPVAAGGAASDVGDAADEIYPDPVCESYTSYECVPGPCSVDSDCAEGMVCHTYTNQMCTGATAPACRPGDPECIVEPVDPPTCTTTTQQQCVARYELPCATATDCGPGFTCEEQQSCWCSGSNPRVTSGAGGAASADEVDVPPVALGTGASSSVASAGAASSEGSGYDDAGTNDSTTEPECGCAPTGALACKLQTIACSADADCPSGLVCVDNPSGSCWASSDGTSGCTTPDPAKVCQPQYYRGSAGGDSVVSPGSAGGGQAATTPDASVDDTSEDESTADNDGNNGNIGPGNFGKGHHRLGGWGCTVATTPGLQHSSLVSLLLTVGLALGMRRRRSQK